MFLISLDITVIPWIVPFLDPKFRALFVKGTVWGYCYLINGIPLNSNTIPQKVSLNQWSQNFKNFIYLPPGGLSKSGYVMQLLYIKRLKIGQAKQGKICLHIDRSGLCHLLSPLGRFHRWPSFSQVFLQRNIFRNFSKM